MIENHIFAFDTTKILTQEGCGGVSETPPEPSFKTTGNADFWYLIAAKPLKTMLGCLKESVDDCEGDSKPVSIAMEGASNIHCNMTHSRPRSALIFSLLVSFPLRSLLWLFMPRFVCRGWLKPTFSKVKKETLDFIWITQSPKRSPSWRPKKKVKIVRHYDYSQTVGKKCSLYAYSRTEAYDIPLLPKILGLDLTQETTAIDKAETTPFCGEHFVFSSQTQDGQSGTSQNEPLLKTLECVIHRTCRKFKIAHIFTRVSVLQGLKSVGLNLAKGWLTCYTFKRKKHRISFR